jgi:hypothetical protein
MQTVRPYLFVILTLCLFCAPTFANKVFYKGSNGVGTGKHLVLVASDHEYRAEETIPALARILSVHGGFDCTVLFGVNDKGEIEAGISNIPGLEVLQKADGLVFFVRFLALPPEQMKHLDEYFGRAGPVVGLRTSTHAFKYDKNRANDPYAKYSFRYTGKEYKGGFGEQVLGQSWVGHYGQNHRQSTRIDLVEAKKKHPILRGVNQVHVQAGGYNAEPQSDWNILTMAQPLMSMKPDGKDDPQKPPKASEWTREYTSKNGKKGRVFTSLYGASQDLLNPGYRRLILNGIYWSVGLENQIKADAKIDFVGSFNPTKFENRGEVKGVKPAMYADLNIPIPADPKAVIQKVQSVTAKNQNIRKGARYVRVEIEDDNRILTLNEVEIISNGKNIAPKGKATQSSTGAGGVASRAIDGNKDPDYNKGGQTHTDGFGSVNPWWEVDLGSEYKIDEVEVWNRKGFESRLNGFTIQLLDANRKKIYKSGKTKGAQRTKFTLRFRTVIDFSLYNGKPEPTAFKPVPNKVNVPDGYKDSLPFSFKKGDRIAILGSGLADRMQHDGWTETLLQSELKGQEVIFRNMSLSGDRPNSYPRSKGFMEMNNYLRHVKADAVFAMFGYNESYDGEKGANRYKQELVNFVKNIRGSKANGETFPRIVLFSPIAFQNLKNRNLPRGKLQNKNLAVYAKVTEDAAKQAGVEFVDLYHPTLALFQKASQPLTINGAHLNEEGNRLLAEIIAGALLKKEVKANLTLNPLRKAVLDKNWHWFNRYRATDGNDIWGGRSKLRFVDDQSNAKVLQHELVMLDVMTANRDQHIWKVAQGEKSKVVDDSNVPAPIKVISNVGGGSVSSSAIKEGSTKYFSPEESLERAYLYGMILKLICLLMSNSFLS